jgi:hypothetical protein
LRGLRPSWVFTLISIALVLAPTSRAAAERIGGEAHLGNNGVSAGAHSESGDSAASAGNRPYHYETTFVASGLGGCTDTVRQYVYRVWDDGSSRRELVYAGCPRVSVPGAPTPPSVAQVRDAVGIPDPTIATNPQPKTLSGMRTDYWYTGPTERAVTVTLNGFTVTATAHATSYRWQFGDGAEVTTTQPGTPQEPATTHAYQHRGDTTITLTVTWTGTFTFTGPGGITGGGDLGAQDFTSSRPIVVEEVQPVGQPAP